MTKVNLKIDEMLFRLARNHVAGSGITTEDFLRNALEEALAMHLEEIRLWREAKIFPLTSPLLKEGHDPLADLEEDPGGGVRLRDDSDLEDEIPF